MAAELASGITVEILKKLGFMALQQIGLARGAKDELRKLQNTVSTIRAVLVNAEEQYDEANPEVADWLQKLSDALDDADDLLDDISTVLRRQVMNPDSGARKVRIFFSRSNQIAFTLKMAHRVGDIRRRLDEIADDRIKFHSFVQPVETRVASRSSRREETHSFVLPEEVIGRDGDKKGIVGRLLNPNVAGNVEIQSIVGIGGLGKTTLAQFVYNDQKVRSYFELQMWVCVSEVFDVKSIAQKVIESATGEKQPENRQMDMVQGDLRNRINGRKYLLVLDDVWNEDAQLGLKLRALLMGGARGSKILITTRSELVAKENGSESPYILEGLSKNDSWSLFKKIAFKQNDEPEISQFVTIGEEIGAKCKGVPLAIRAIGSLLRCRDTLAEWLYIKEKDMLKIAQEENIIMPILKLSYNYLPPHLKRCFAFCSVFQKDDIIFKEELIQLWMANGLIHGGDENSDLEDKGYSYFMELMRRSLFQVSDLNLGWYKMHDLVHDLAQLVSRQRSMVLDLSGNNNICERTHHVSFGYNIDSSWSIPVDLFKANMLRTFLFPKEQSWKENVVNKLALEKIVSGFKKLRVLDLHATGMEMVPSCIGELKQLRYLDLSWNMSLKVVPNCITKLVNLQTLKLDSCYKLEELPKDLRKLVSLRHLELHRCYELRCMPRGIGQLSGLCKLTWFVVESCRDLSELKCLNNIRGELCLLFKEARDVKCTSSSKEEEEEAKRANYLNGKQYLEQLKLDLRRSRDLDEWVVDEGLRPHPNLTKLNIYEYKGGRLPRWMMDDILLSLPRLVSLSLIGIHSCKELPQLGLLPSLQCLLLDSVKEVEYIDSSSTVVISSSTPTTFFQSLIELSITDMPSLEGWRRTTTGVEEQTKLLPSIFPRLSELEINGCPKLVSMPDLPSCLQTLALFGVSQKLVQQLMSRRSACATTPLPFSLYIHNIKSLLTPPELPSQTLASLRSLSISGCGSLTSLSPWMPHLTALRELRIEWCPELDLSGDDDGLQFQCLTSLNSLHIRSVPKLASLPLGLHRLTSLSSLTVVACENLETLPRCISNLTSLHTLKIHHCPCTES